MLSAHVRIPGLQQAMGRKPAWQHWILNADARAVVFTLDGREDYLILFKPREGETPETTDAAGFVNRLVPVDNSLIFISFVSRLRAKRTDSLTNRFFLLSIRPV